MGFPAVAAHSNKLCSDVLHIFSVQWIGLGWEGKGWGSRIACWLTMPQIPNVMNLGFKWLTESACPLRKKTDKQLFLLSIFKVNASQMIYKNPWYCACLEYGVPRAPSTWDRNDIRSAHVCSLKVHLQSVHHRPPYIKNRPSLSTHSELMTAQYENVHR